MMRRFSRGLAATGALALALQGCSSDPSVPGVLPKSARTSSGGRDLIVVIPQEHIRADIEQSNLRLGGLFVGGLVGGALMDSVDKSIEKSRQKAADAKLAGLRKMLADYDFDHRAIESTAGDLRGLGWWGQKSETMTRDASDLNIKQMLTKLDSQQTLVATYDYSLSKDFSSLELTLQTFLVPTREAIDGDPKKIDPAKIVWMDRFVFVENLDNPSKRADDNLQQWADNRGQRTRDTFDRGMNQLLTLLNTDLTRTTEEIARIDHQREVTIGEISGKLAEGSPAGTLLHQPDAQQWVFVAGISLPEQPSAAETKPSST